MTARFFDWLQLAGLALLVGLFVGRAWVLHIRGVSILVVDRQWPKTSMLFSLLAGGVLLGWIHEIVASAWPLEFLISGVIVLVAMHAGILLEEKHLAQIYGQAYLEYRSRVGRYATRGHNLRNQ